MIWGTDPDRVYATGMSNGAEMVYRLAAEMGGRLAAIAPVSGAPTDPGQIAPATPISLVTFTGTADGRWQSAAEGLETWPASGRDAPLLPSARTMTATARSRSPRQHLGLLRTAPAQGGDA